MISCVQIECGVKSKQHIVEYKEVINRINDCTVWLASLPPLQSIVICGYGFACWDMQSNANTYPQQFSIKLSYCVPDVRIFYDEMKYYIDNNILTNNRHGYKLSDYLCEDLHKKRELMFTKYSLIFVPVIDSNNCFQVNDQVSELYVDEEGSCIEKRLQAWDPVLVI